MKRIIVFLSLLSVTFTLSAQSIETAEWGRKFQIDESTSYCQTAGYDSENTYYVRTADKVGINKKKIWLESVSSTDNTLSGSNEVALPKIEGFQSEYEFIAYKNKKLILFSSTRNVNRNKYVLYVSYLKPDGRLENKPKEVASIPMSNEPADGFDIFYTKDQKNLVVESHKTYKKYNSEKINFVILDFELSEVFKGDVVLDAKYNNLDVQILQKEVSAKNIILLAKSEPKSTRRSSRAKPYNYNLFVYNYSNKTMHEFLVKMSKFSVADARFTINKEGNAVVGGFVKGRTSRFANEKQGMFFKRYDLRTMKAIPDVNIKSFYKKFDRKFMTQIMNPMYGETKDIQYAYSVHSVEELANGSYMIVAEQKWEDSRVVGKDTEPSLHYYNYNNIMIGGVNKKGIFEWIKIYPKKQFTTNDNAYYSSLVIVPVMNKLKIFYNGHDGNLGKKELKKVKVFKNNLRSKPNGRAAIYTIYSDGSFERDPMFKSKDDAGVFIKPILGKNSVEYGVLIQNKKTYRFGSFFLE